MDNFDLGERREMLRRMLRNLLSQIQPRLDSMVWQTLNDALLSGRKVHIHLLNGESYSVVTVLRLGEGAVEVVDGKVIRLLSFARIRQVEL